MPVRASSARGTPNTAIIGRYGLMSVTLVASGRYGMPLRSSRSPERATTLISLCIGYCPDVSVMNGTITDPMVATTRASAVREMPRLIGASPTNAAIQYPMAAECAQVTCVSKPDRTYTRYAPQPNNRYAVASICRVPTRL
ncbi:hypothetical protein M2359_001761 [Gordonia amarae]|nr:hypothetical protein [Gordonia amarae]